MNTLEQRISKMEKTIKLYRLGFTTLIVAGFSISLMSSGKKVMAPEKIQAKSFEVVDSRGNVIAFLGEDGGGGILTTYGKTGNKQTSLFQTTDGGGGINTFNKNGYINFKVTNSTGGGGYMAMFNENVKEIVEFGVTTSQSGYMRINDKNSEKLAWITNTNDGGGYFSLSGYDNQEVIRMSSPKIGARIGIYNGSKARIAYMGTQETGSGNISVYSSTGNTLGSIPN